ncbi:hypothetical protein MNBD_UNCLBAC01-1525 [hydrothermal vent metagenome]|uniref:Uncharacterized protein n=1 Tax=hydrothermal vent metagenome TaxID=652676 RepID=A0A3B1CW71_9ZZZZ
MMKIFLRQLNVIIFCFFLGLASSGEASEVGSLARNNLQNIIIKEEQVLEVNKSLKNLIEENQRLVNRSNHLEQEMKRVKNDSVRKQGEYKNIKSDRDGLAQSVQKIRSTNRRYSKKIKHLEKEILRLENMKDMYEKKEALSASSLDAQWGDTLRESDVPERENTMELASAEEEFSAQDEVKEHENNTMDLLTKIDAFAENDERLRTDAAKAHYNMGNIYFQKGEYAIAVREYYQAVTLMPNDPDVHYNLAFVSGEYLKDHKMALKHYRMYLYLSPKAKDLPFVKKQILRSELALRSVVDSPLEKDY